eukprot:tig00000532_g1891.t1
MAARGRRELGGGAAAAAALAEGIGSHSVVHLHAAKSKLTHARGRSPRMAAPRLNGLAGEGRSRREWGAEHEARGARLGIARDAVRGTEAAPHRSPARSSLVTAANPTEPARHGAPLSWRSPAAARSSAPTAPRGPRRHSLPPPARPRAPPSPRVRPGGARPVGAEAAPAGRGSPARTPQRPQAKARASDAGPSCGGAGAGRRRSGGGGSRTKQGRPRSRRCPELRAGRRAPPSPASSPADRPADGAALAPPTPPAPALLDLASGPPAGALAEERLAAAPAEPRAPPERP